jgi:hypothetical protein
MITHEDLNRVGSGSTIPDILIASAIINSNPEIKNFYEFGTWVGGFIISVNRLTDNLKFYASETMEHFKFQELKNRLPLVKWGQITSLDSLDLYIKEASLREYNKKIDLTMFISNDTMIKNVSQPLDFIHFDCIVDGDEVYHTAKNLIENNMSEHGIFCVDDFGALCGFRTIAISKLISENKLFPFYFGDKKVFCCKSQGQQDIAVDLLLNYSKTEESKEKFALLYKNNQNFRSFVLSFNGTRHRHFRYDQRWTKTEISYE